MNAQRFNRHADMDPTTLDEIMEIINVREERLPFSVKNSLYGLFDGFLYFDLLSDAEKNLSPALAQRIKNVIRTVQQYPSLN